MRRILLTSVLAVAMLGGSAVPASAASGTRMLSRCTVTVDSQGRRVVICTLPPIAPPPPR